MSKSACARKGPSPWSGLAVLARGTSAGLEEASQLVGAEVAAAGLRLAAYSLDGNRAVVIFGRHQAQVPALAEDAAERGQHAIAGGRLVMIREQLADTEDVGAPEPVPGHGLGAIDRGGAAGDRIKGAKLGASGGGRQAGEVGRDRVAEVGESRRPVRGANQVGSRTTSAGRSAITPNRHHQSCSRLAEHAYGCRAPSILATADRMLSSTGQVRGTAAPPSVSLYLAISPSGMMRRGN